MANQIVDSFGSPDPTTVIFTDFADSLDPELISDYGVVNLVVTVTTTPLLGDVNLDEVVNFSDIPAFIQVLTSGHFQPEADIDGSGKVNYLDVKPFIEIIISLGR